jgi:hypothetical protein
MLLPRINLHAPDALLAVLAAACAYNNQSLAECQRAVQATIACAFVRGVAVQLTLMPSPVPATAIVGTHNLMFSGHTLCFCCAAAMLQAPAIAASGMIVLVAARAHYTIDVLVAALVWHAAFSHLLEPS